MGAVVFIGDELGATGFRLAGATVHVPAPGAEAALLREARRSAGLVLIGAASAARIPPAELEEALAAPQPLVLVVAELRDTSPAGDIGPSLRALLGLAG